MRPPRLIFARFLTVYALLYAAFGVQSPFLPALLEERGLRPDEIGLVMAASTAIRVLAGPAVAHAADRWRRHGWSLCACAIAAAIAGVGYLTIFGFRGLLTIALMQAVALAPIVPVSDALATTAAQQSEVTRDRFDYGWLRAGGSAAFIAGTFLSGWAASQAGLGSIVWVSGVFLLIGGGTALLLPGLGGAGHVGSAFRTPTLRDCALLLRLAPFRRILFIAALIEGSHALNDNFSVIYWRSAGISLGTVSFLWSESVMAEVLVFSLIGPGLIRWIGAGGGCGLAAAAGAVRWSILACTTSPLLLAVAQPLHGLTFALLHLASMRVIVLVVPVRLAATAQSVYGTFCVGLATALLTLVSGLLYQQIGGRAFLVMAALCLVALPMCTGLRASRMEESQAGSGA
jgi:MFS transporter, PPP family, 3-phenylpropionic acid transporter